MASGTKIILAVLALIAIGVFIYYATIPQGNGSSGTNTSGDQVAESATQRPGDERSDRISGGMPAPEAPPASMGRAPSTTHPVDEKAPVASGQAPLANLPAGREEGGLGDSVRRALAGDESRAVSVPAPADLLDAAGSEKTGEAGISEADQKPADGAAPTKPAEKPEQKPASSPAQSDQKPPVAPAGDKPPATPPAGSAPLRYTEYVVKSGDTLSSIAGDWFGDPNKWDLIYRANPQIDKDRLDIGQKLRLPPKDVTRAAIRPPQTGGVNVHVVGSGETLSGIAKAYYGDPNKWRIIYEANRAIIGADPNDLNVGMKLTIPPAPKPAEQAGNRN
jgi:nucleoid-associated protein YgaU